MNVRDAMMSVLFGLDYENYQLKTPHIAAVIDRENRTGAPGIVRHDALLVRVFTPRAGEAFYLATYEHDYPDNKFKDSNFSVVNAEEVCDYIIGNGVFKDLELPVSAASSFESNNGFTIAYKTIK